MFIKRGKWLEHKMAKSQAFCGHFKGIAFRQLFISV